MREMKYKNVYNNRWRGFLSIKLEKQSGNIYLDGYKLEKKKF